MQQRSPQTTLCKMSLGQFFYFVVCCISFHSEQEIPVPQLDPMRRFRSTGC